MKYHMTKVGNVYVTDPNAGAPEDCALVAVIPVEDREAVERLRDSWVLARNRGDSVADGLQAALREFANPTPPRPDEPQGLGAVVEDADGVLWLAVGAASPVDGDYRWARDGRVAGTWSLYADIAVVRVLSAGVES